MLHCKLLVDNCNTGTQEKLYCFGLNTVFFVNCVNINVIDVLRLSMNFMIDWRGKGQSRNHPRVRETKKNS